MKPATHHLSSRRSHAPVGLPAGRMPAHRRRHDEKPPDAFDPNETGGFSRLLATLPLTFALTAATGAALVTVAAAVAYRSIDPSALSRPLSYGALGICALVGGIIAGRRCGRSFLAGGFLSGSLFAVVLILLSLVIPGETDVSPWLMWGTRPAVVLLHLLGAYLVRPREKAASHTAGKHPSRARR